MACTPNHSLFIAYGNALRNRFQRMIVNTDSGMLINDLYSSLQLIRDVEFRSNFRVIPRIHGVVNIPPMVWEHAEPMTVPTPTLVPTQIFTEE